MRLVRIKFGLFALVLCPVLIAAGCQSSGRDDGGGILMAGLPPAAEQVSEGSGQLTYVPEEEGRLFLYDVNRDRVIGRYAVRKGQRLAVDAAVGRATSTGTKFPSASCSRAGRTASTSWAADVAA